MSATDTASIDALIRRTTWSSNVPTTVSDASVLRRVAVIVRDGRR